MSTNISIIVRIVLPGMLSRKRGSIVNIGSAAGVSASPLLAQYGAAKGPLRNNGVMCTTESARASRRDIGGTAVAIVQCERNTSVRVRRKLRIGKCMFVARAAVLVSEVSDLAVGEEKLQPIHEA